MGDVEQLNNLVPLPKTSIPPEVHKVKPNRNPTVQVPITTAHNLDLKWVKWSTMAEVMVSIKPSIESIPNIRSIEKNRKEIKGGEMGALAMPSG